VTKKYETGVLLQGKKNMICATWNAPKEAFENTEQQLFQGKTTARFIFAHFKQLSFLRL
jgi:modulator of drug activity B